MVELAALVVSVASVAIAVAAWKRPRNPAKSPPPSFDASMDTTEEKGKFLDFLQRHELKLIRLDVTMDADVASPTGNWLASKSFTVNAGGDDWGGDLGKQWEINIKVDQVEDSPLTYAHGVWRLRGYFAVEEVAGTWQGIMVRNLVPVPLDRAAE